MFRQKLLLPSSGRLNWFQVRYEVIEENKYRIPVRRFELLRPIGATEIEEHERFATFFPVTRTFSFLFTVSLRILMRCVHLAAVLFQRCYFIELL